ncbi:MAG: hypothetical protein IPK82_19355 [Polyangiaceae bacterium]|nr:hypothetical protein [Polyangiaceae bacterium]
MSQSNPNSGSVDSPSGLSGGHLPSPYLPTTSGLPSPFQAPGVHTAQNPPGPPNSPKKKAAWFVIPAVVIVAGALGYGCFAGFDVEPKPSDRELLITVEDVTAGLSFQKDAKFETIKRTWYIDGSVDLTYEYDDTNGKVPVYISSQVTRTASRKDADGQYVGMKLGAKAVFGMMTSDLSEVPRDDWIKWGDRSTSVALSVPQGYVGYYFVGQKGDRVVLFVLGGLPVTEDGSLAKMLLPKLEKAASGGL